jgi:predicted Fe-S protein YdhL (DUF1289 family)
VDEETNTMCVGCGRTLEEITEWFYADSDRKKVIAAAAKERSKKHRKTVFDRLIETDSFLL